MNVRCLVVAALLLLIGAGCRMTASFDWTSSMEPSPTKDGPAVLEE